MTVPGCVRVIILFLRGFSRLIQGLVRFFYTIELGEIRSHLEKSFEKFVRLTMVNPSEKT
ncbi:MAG: hypothetical protein DRH17_07100 [Deltaproteobacteria bacterium]|nr:MAG: hypothetical protein DRH17_07100 [Deltaproteobacteria bacterium]